MEESIVVPGRNIAKVVVAVSDNVAVAVVIVVAIIIL